MINAQKGKDAQELWQYWQAVFDWVKRVFSNQDSARAKLMKGLSWGKFYNEHKDDKLNAAELERRIGELIDDDEVDSKKGIYEYLLTGNEKTLSLRAFDEKTKQKVYAKQKGICPVCKKTSPLETWRPTIFFRGVEEAKQRQRIATCFARWITGRRAENKQLARKVCIQ